MNLPLVHNGRGFGGNQDALTGMTEDMHRNIWIGIGIIAIVLTLYGFYVMRKKSKK
jgi:hypothetical protein